MNSDAAPAGHTYFLPPQRWFWHWQEHGRVAVWDDGTTIAFRDELEKILRHLTPQGLPPLGSLVLLLGACRESWNETPGRAIALVNLLTRLRGTSRDFASLRGLCDGLDRVRDLPSDLRSSLEARAELASVVFETARQCTSDEVARSLLANWPKWRTDDAAHPLREASLAQFLQELHALLGGLAKVDEHTLRLRLKTGLEALPAPAPIKAEEARTAQALLQKLADDPELSGVARLARHLLAVVSLPRPIADPADMPEGGISDISNRGPLDRLLLSELAHDSAMLAVRVAMNEALYYRRETPPSPPPRARKVLIDSGIRMWGVPRVFAAAAGLALAAQPDKKLETTVFRASGRYLDQVDFTTRDGLAEHLAALETAAHPGEALAEFLAEVDDDERAAEGVLITCDDALADAEFHRRMAECQFDTLYIATVAREGHYRLIVRSRRGMKVLREATLDLDAILSPRPEQTKLIDPARDISRPAIFQVKPFPLLLSVPLEPDRSWHAEGIGVFTYTRDGRLLHWLHPGNGARQLAEDLPQGRLFACECAAREGMVLAVIGKLAPNGLHVLRIDYGQLQVSSLRLQFPETPQPEVAIYRDTVLLRAAGIVTALNTFTGEVLSHTALGIYKNQLGRIGTANIATVHQTAIIGFDGQQAKLHLSHFGQQLPPLAAFEARGIEGVVAITASGDIDIDDGKTRKKTVVNHGLFPPLRFAGVSRDGLRFILQGQGSKGVRPAPDSRVFPKQVLVYTLTGATREVYGDFKPSLEPYLHQYVRTRTLRSRFLGVGLSERRELMLLGRKRLAWAIEFDHATKHLRLARTPSNDVPRSLLRFEPVSGEQRAHNLQCVQSQDSTIFWLDGRGLLHLRSSDATLPELSLVLCEGPLAGWTSDGRVWGPEYFHGQQPELTADDVYHRILKRIIDRITP